MSTVAVLDRKRTINERYWKVSFTEPSDDSRGGVVFAETPRQIADSLGIRKETLKNHVQPRAFTLSVRCRRCEQSRVLTKEFSSQYELQQFYPSRYMCDECWASDQQEETNRLDSFNATLREKYGSLIVRECPNCGRLTHIAFDPVTVDFYEVCENMAYTEDGETPCFTTALTGAGRKAFLPKIIALLQAKSALS